MRQSVNIATYFENQTIELHVFFVLLAHESNLNN